MNSRFIFSPIAALINLVLFTWWYLRTSDFLFIIGALALINLILAFWLNKSRRDWWGFALLPIIFSISALLYGLVASNNTIILIILIVAYLILMIYWRLVFVYVFKRLSYRAFSLERMFYYLGFISIFLFSAAAYGIKTFINVPMWQLIGSFLLFQIILTYLWFWVNKFDLNISWPYGVALLFMMLELFFVMTLLPLNFNVSGFMIASSWHGLSFLATENIGGRLNFKRGRLIIIFMVIIWLAVLITARWF